MSLEFVHFSSYADQSWNYLTDLKKFIITFHENFLNM